MPVIRPEFHTSLVTQTINEIFYQRSSLFYFLGKIDTWGVEEDPPSEPSSTLYNDVLIRDNILYLKKISPSEVSLVATSYEWESGTVFTQWDHTQVMQNTNFYCITDEYNVYKCLDNNNGSDSTVKPTSNSLFPFRTSDGYLWKYMYNVPSFKRVKFLSRGYLPTQRALTDAFYNKGAVEQVVVTNGGSDYTDVQLTTITVSGTTTGSGATAEITSVSASGAITGVSLIGGGSGYTKGANVIVDSIAGTGAVITIEVSGGVITDLVIEDGGIGYSTSDDIDITVGGAVITPIVSQTTGSILEVRIDNAGAGYTAAPTLTAVGAGGAGEGKYGNADAVLTAVVYGGSVVNVTIEDPGVDYPADSATTIVVSGDGTGASFSPVISNGELVDVVVENTGTDYSYISLTVVGAGTGAEVTAVLASSDFLSDQSSVEQVAVRGAIYSVVVTEPGDNYSLESEVVIEGDGTGAEATLTINEDDGSIEQITMTSFGQGYTRATITIDDPNRTEPNDYTDMEAYATLPPVTGHGYDAVKELYADTLSIFTIIKSDEELTLLAQDYRQYGLLLNPTNVFTSKLVTDDADIIAFELTVTDTEGMSPDDILICNNKRYRVVSVDGSTVKLQQLNSIYGVPSGSLVDESNESISYSIQSVVVEPSTNKYSGNLMYVTNSAPFTPTDEQSIAIRTYVKL